MKKILVATTAAATLVAGAGTAAVLVAGPASADTERRGVCSTGDYSLEVDREGRGYDVSVDVDGLRPGTRWRVVLRHDGRVVADRVLRADSDGELELDRWRPDTSGADTFRFTAQRSGSSVACGASVRV